MKKYKAKVRIFFKDGTEKTFICTVYDCYDTAEAKEKLKQSITQKFPDNIKTRIYEPELIKENSSFKDENALNFLKSMFNMK